MCIAFLVYNVVEGENKSVTLYENFVWQFRDSCVKFESFI